MGRLSVLAGYCFQYFAVNAAVLPNIERGKVQTKYMHFIDEVVNQVLEQSIVLVDQYFPYFLQGVQDALFA